MEYAKTDPSPLDSLEVLAAEGYLRALNNIFERGQENLLILVYLRAVLTTCNLLHGRYVLINSDDYVDTLLIPYAL